MAKKAEEKVISLGEFQKTHFRVEIIGDGELMLHKMDRQTERKLVFIQSNPKGTDIPPELDQPTNIWQKLITSIHWLNPIEYHDEDISLYSEEELTRYLAENQPCILATAFRKSFKETVTEFYKASGLTGASLKRSIVLCNTLCPIKFSESRVHTRIVNTREDGGGSSVLMTCNIFSGWKTEIEFQTATKVFPNKTMLQIMQTAGEMIGIGSQRAAGYGRYHIGNVDILS